MRKGQTFNVRLMQTHSQPVPPPPHALKWKPRKGTLSSYQVIDLRSKYDTSVTAIKNRRDISVACVRGADVIFLLPVL